MVLFLKRCLMKVNECCNAISEHTQILNSALDLNAVRTCVQQQSMCKLKICVTLTVGQDLIYNRSKKENIVLHIHKFAGLDVSKEC